MILFLALLGWPVARILWHLGRLVYYKRQIRRWRMGQ
jgi:hypothetical protein